MWNPLDSAKQVLKVVDDSLNTLSQELSGPTAELIPKLSGGLLKIDTNKKSEHKKSEHKSEHKSEQKKNQGNKSEQKKSQTKKNNYDSKFIGCYLDDPSNLSMSNFLGDVTNIPECLALGNKNNNQYVGIQQGNKCYGSNTIPTTIKVDKDSYCNILCDNNSDYCGGYYYNQVYKTSDNGTPTLTENEYPNILENFVNNDIEVNKINENLLSRYNCYKPINSYELFFWLLIILIIILYLPQVLQIVH